MLAIEHADHDAEKARDLRHQVSSDAACGPTDLEFSCEHPPVEPSEEKVLDGRSEVVEDDARVIVSWNEVLGGVIWCDELR